MNAPCLTMELQCRECRRKHLARRSCTYCVYFPVSVALDGRVSFGFGQDEPGSRSIPMSIPSVCSIFFSCRDLFVLTIAGIQS